MQELSYIDYDRLSFRDNTVIYDGKSDPVFDAPLASIISENGFKIENNKIIMTFNDDQYIYDIMHSLLIKLVQTVYAVDEYPIWISDDLCNIQLVTNKVRIPVYLTTTGKGNSKCYLNIDELKDFISEGLGFRLQFKIKVIDNEILLCIMSIQFPDMFDGDKDYLDYNDNSDNDNECNDDDSFDWIDEPDEELIDYTVKL